MLGYILDAIDWALEIASDAITYIGTELGRVYRKIKVWTKNRRTGKIVVRSETEPVNRNDVPAEILRQLDSRSETEVMRTSIRN